MSAESTVVAEYMPDAAYQAAYQSESALEQELIRLLGSQAYEYVAVTSEAQLVANLRVDGAIGVRGVSATHGRCTPQEPGFAPHKSPVLVSTNRRFYASVDT